MNSLPTVGDVAEQLRRVNDNLDRLREDSHDIQVNMVEIRKDLNYHIHRTDMLEERIDGIDETQKSLSEIATQFRGLVKILTVTGVTISMIVGITQLIRGK